MKKFLNEHHVLCRLIGEIVSLITCILFFTVESYKLFCGQPNKITVCLWCLWLLLFIVHGVALGNKHTAELIGTEEDNVDIEWHLIDNKYPDEPVCVIAVMREDFSLYYSLGGFDTENQQLRCALKDEEKDKPIAWSNVLPLPEVSIKPNQVDKNG